MNHTQTTTTGYRSLAWNRVFGLWLLSLAAAVVLTACGSAEEAAPAGEAVAPAAQQAPAGAAEGAEPALREITTYAGSGNPQFSGDGGPATEAGFFAPTGVTLDDGGNLFISADHRVRRVDANTGIITTLAGTGKNRSNGDDGPATEAAIADPRGLAVDSAGNVFFAENGSGRIRRVDAQTGIITTVAGGGIGNPREKIFGDGSAATEAMVKLPDDVAIDSQGNLYIATDNRIRKVDSATGIIDTIAGTGERGVDGDGSTATEVALADPVGVALDEQGNIYIADRDNHRVRKVDSGTGTMTTLAGTGKFHTRSGLFYRGRFDATAPTVLAASGAGYSGDGGPSDAAKLTAPSSVPVGPGGNVFVADGAIRVRKIDTSTGIITTVATGESVATHDTGKVLVITTGLGEVASVAINAAGDIFLADYKNNSVLRVPLP